MSLQDANEIGHAGAVAAITDVPRAAAAVWMRALPDPAKKIDYQAHAMQMKRRCKPHRHSGVAAASQSMRQSRACSVPHATCSLSSFTFASGLRLLRTTRDPGSPAKHVRPSVMFCRMRRNFPGPDVFG